MRRLLEERRVLLRQLTTTTSTTKCLQDGVLARRPERCYSRRIAWVSQLFWAVDFVRLPEVKPQENPACMAIKETERLRIFECFFFKIHYYYES